MLNQPVEIAPSARNGSASSPHSGQYITWPGNKLQLSGWIVGESPGGEWFYINAQANSAATYDFMVSRRAIIEGIVEVKI